MRIPIYESKLIKTVRFEPEELDKIEQVTKTVQQEAEDDRLDPPSENSIIRMLVRLGLEEYRRRQETDPSITGNMRNMRKDEK